MTATDLLSRLREATAPSRELDAEIDRLLGIHVDFGPLSGPWSEYPEPDRYRETFRYTASVDCALALAERALGSGSFDIEVALRSVVGQTFGRAEIVGPNVDQLARAATPALALCICVLTAKQAEGQNQ